MTEQYIRKATLIVTPQDNPGVDLSELHFKFSVKRGDLQTPNSIDVRVYNVSEQTTAAIMGEKSEAEFSRLILQCGYGDNLGVLFDGTIKTVPARAGKRNRHLSRHHGGRR